MTRVRWITLTALAGALTVAPAAAVAQEEVEVAAGPASVSAIAIPAGTDILVTVNQDITIDEKHLNDTYEAQVTRDVVVDGRVAIRQGAPAMVRLVRSEENAEQATLRLSQVQLAGEMRSVTTENARADTEKDRSGTAKKTGIGAAAGAVIGAVTGVGVIKGAILGAGGGLAWGLLGGRDREVGRGTQLEFELSESVNTQ
ncbi:MAG TPA: hypothetical protein VFM14_07090 [Gemmatimonadales bacterium]|nr:hypothetical protein [Gemmatimonadales bacterium]